MTPEYKRTWAQRNPDRTKAADQRRRCNPLLKWGLYKAQAERRGLEFALAPEEVAAMVLLPCHYSGHLYRDRLNGIDRLDNSIGYVAYNVVPCCWVCNRAKLNMPHSEFIDWIKTFRYPDGKPIPVGESYASIARDAVEHIQERALAFTPKAGHAKGVSRGERHVNAKISSAQALEIRELYQGGLSQGKIGSRFGLSRSNVGCIVRGETWSVYSILEK